MLVVELIILLLLVLALIWGVWIYNLLVRDRHRVAAAWSDIDVQLKRRHDLIPKLVESVQSYSAYEQATLQNLTLLRARSQQTDDPQLRGPVETELTSNIQRLLALAEAYPDLKANQNFLALQNELTDTEDKIQAARRFYNMQVRNLNTKVQSIPTNMIAGFANVTEREFFEIDNPAERETPQVSF